jgi:hypothetical protein
LTGFCEPEMMAFVLRKSQTIREGGVESHGSLNAKGEICEWVSPNLVRVIVGSLARAETEEEILKKAAVHAHA